MIFQMYGWENNPFSLTESKIGGGLNACTAFTTVVISFKIIDWS